MENFYENLLKEIANDAADNKATEALSDTTNSMVRPETRVRASGTDIWKAILASCQQVPAPLRNAFVVQVLICILHDQEISMESLHKALRQASDAVQRVEEAKRYRDAA